MASTGRSSDDKQHPLEKIARQAFCHVSQVIPRCTNAIVTLNGTEVKCSDEERFYRHFFNRIIEVIEEHIGLAYCSDTNFRFFLMATMAELYHVGNCDETSSAVMAYLLENDLLGPRMAAVTKMVPCGYRDQHGYIAIVEYNENKEVENFAYIDPWMPVNQWSCSINSKLCKERQDIVLVTLTKEEDVLKNYTSLNLDRQCLSNSLEQLKQNYLKRISETVGEGVLTNPVFIKIQDEIYILLKDWNSYASFRLKKIEGGVPDNLKNMFPSEAGIKQINEKEISEEISTIVEKHYPSYQVPCQSIGLGRDLANPPRVRVSSARKKFTKEDWHKYKEFFESISLQLSNNKKAITCSAVEKVKPLRDYWLKKRNERKVEEGGIDTIDTIGIKNIEEFIDKQIDLIHAKILEKIALSKEKIAELDKADPTSSTTRIITQTLNLPLNVKEGTEETPTDPTILATQASSDENRNDLSPHAGESTEPEGNNKNKP